MDTHTHAPSPFDDALGMPRLRLDETGRLLACPKGREAPLPVEVKACFPWTGPDQYLSLRDAQGQEVALVPHASLLDAASAEALETAIRRARFSFEVTAVRNVEDDFELRNWEVETRSGPRRFQTGQEDWPTRLPDGGILIKDLAGDLYAVPPMETMDRQSRKLLWAFVG